MKNLVEPEMFGVMLVLVSVTLFSGCSKTTSQELERSEAARMLQPYLQIQNGSAIDGFFRKGMGGYLILAVITSSSEIDGPAVEGLDGFVVSQDTSEEFIHAMLQNRIDELSHPTARATVSELITNDFTYSKRQNERLTEEIYQSVNGDWLVYVQIGK